MFRENVVIAEVDADADRVLADRFEIHGYPTLKFFPAGEKVEAEDYKGDRSLDALVNFMNDKAGMFSPFQHLTNHKTFLKQ